MEIDDKKTTINYTVLIRDTDFSLRMSLVSIGNIFMNVAGFDSEQKGFGMEALHKKGMAWVALRMHIQVYEYPAAFDELTVTTWIEQWTKLSTQRNCIIKNKNGKILVEISSLWALIDFKTRQLLNLQDELSAFGYEKWLVEESTSIGSALKVHVPTNEELVGKHIVAYSDIDSNLHATSLKYVEWVLDTLPFELFKNQRISSFEINYAKECCFGEHVSIFREKLSEDTFLYELKDSNGNSLNRCKLTFSNI